MELYHYRGRVINIVDGDTVDAEVDVGFGISVRQRFRIDGIDTPETWRPRNEAEREHGLQATQRATELLMDKNLIFKSSKVPGIYGRYAATIWLEDGRKYTEVMINEGFKKRENY
jgi:micrococcal nuclease